jgi:hypothetical protein
MLAYYVSTFAIELSFATHPDETLKFGIITHYIAAASSAAACVTILIMPFREHSLPSIDISAVGQQPSSGFRTPEDNLKLWQFLTVSWMAPLISTGRKRQLNEHDVWLLGFEFQHRRLHEKFRQLRGSVLGRLLQANGIDVFIISTISIVQIICGNLKCPLPSGCFSANHLCRLFYTSIIATTAAGHEGPNPAQAGGFDLCISIIRAETRRRAGSSHASMVWSKIL